MQKHTDERWIENASTIFRIAGPARDFARIDHRGWYMSEDCCDVAEGYVLRLPHGRYLAAMLDPNNDDAFLVDVRHVHDTERDAALAADEIARVYAEAAREDDAAYRVSMRYFDLLADVRAYRAEHSAAVRAGKPMTWRIVDRAHDAIEEIRAMRREHDEATLLAYA